MSLAVGHGVEQDVLQVLGEGGEVQVLELYAGNQIDIAAVAAKGKDLACCAWMRRAKLDIQHLVPGRRYTFPELRALYGVRLELYAGNQIDIAAVAAKGLFPIHIPMQGRAPDHLAQGVQRAAVVLPMVQKPGGGSLRQCRDVPVKLTRQQQDQLLEPYVPGSTLFRSSPFREVWELLERCPDLASPGSSRATRPQASSSWGRPYSFSQSSDK